MAKFEVEGRNVEGKYAWKNSWSQEDDHVTIKIKLVPDAGVTITNAMKTRWKNGIENKWSNKFDCCSGREHISTVIVTIKFVTNGEHLRVRIRSGRGRGNRTTWFEGSSGNTAAHEIGHQLGLIDEYADPNVPNREVNPGNVMGDNSKPAVKRHFLQICANIKAVPCNKVGGS